MNQKGLALILIVLLVTAVIGVGGYFIYTNYSNNLPAGRQDRTNVVQTTPTPTSNPTANWKTYTDSKYKYTFKYPSMINYAKVRTEFPSANDYNIQLQYQDSKLVIVNLIAGRGISPIKTVPITISGNNTVKWYINDSLIIVDNIQSSNSKHSIGFEYHLSKDSVNSKNQEKLFDQILSTFRFD